MRFFSAWFTKANKSWDHTKKKKKKCSKQNYENKTFLENPVIISAINVKLEDKRIFLVVTHQNDSQFQVLTVGHQVRKNVKNCYDWHGRGIAEKFHIGVMTCELSFGAILNIIQRRSNGTNVKGIFVSSRMVAEILTFDDESLQC